MEKRKFEDKDETDYYDSLEFCAEIVCDILDTHLLSHLSEYKVKTSEVSEWTRKGLEELTASLPCSTWTRRPRPRWSTS